MKTFVIEREIPAIGAMAPAELHDTARVSNAALATLAPRVQWQHSYIAGNKTFCIYLAENAALIEEHARLSGFPADTVTEISARIDPTWG